jgi:hypothetical protein
VSLQANFSSLIRREPPTSHANKAHVTMPYTTDEAACRPRGAIEMRARRRECLSRISRAGYRCGDLACRSVIRTGSRKARIHSTGSDRMSQGIRAHGIFGPEHRFGLGGVPLGNEFEVVTDEDAYVALKQRLPRGAKNLASNSGPS